MERRHERRSGTYPNPLIGTLVGVGTAIAQDIRAQGANVGDFQAEIARFDAAVAQGQAADAAWRARHNVPAPGTEIQPSDPEQPSPDGGLTPPGGTFGDQ
jgi:hypothetical protein